MKKVIAVFLMFAIISALLVGCGDTQKKSDSQIEIESCEVSNETTEDSFTIKYKIKNISDETIPFFGLSVKELDDSGDILDNYYSYDEDTIKTELEPGQSVYLELSFPKDKDIAKVESNEYVLYGDDNATTTLPMSNTYVVDVETGVGSEVVEENDDLSNQEKEDNNKSGLSEVEPYLNYVGNFLVNGSLPMSEEDNANKDSVKIFDIAGRILPHAYSIGEYYKVCSSISWESIDSTYSMDDFEDVIQAVVDYYAIDLGDDFDDESTSVLFDNKYYTINCTFNNGSISVEWSYHLDNYNQTKLCGHIAVKVLEDALKNPESLQVHEIEYCSPYLVDYEDALGYRIDYSAENGFGGYNRDYYYVLIDPETYSQISYFLSADTVLADSTFKDLSINLDNINEVKPAYEETETVLVSAPENEIPTASGIMDKTLMGYLSYLGMQFKDIKVLGQNTGSYNYKLGDAEFVGIECPISIYFGADGNLGNDSEAYLLQVNLSVSDMSTEDLFNILTENLGTEAYDISTDTDGETRSFKIDIPDTEFVIEVFGAAGRDILITDKDNEEDVDEDDISNEVGEETTEESENDTSQTTSGDLVTGGRRRS